jgi:hypothetical protein
MEAKKVTELVDILEVVDRTEENRIDYRDQY